MADLLKHASHYMPYHAEFGRSALKDADKIQENPEIGKRWNLALL